MPAEQTLKRFFDIFNRRDLEAMGKILSQDAEFYFPKTRPLMGRDRILRFFRILFRQYPELSFEIRRTITEGKNGAVHWTNRGVSRKGEPYENEGVTILELAGDRITCISDFFKDTEKF
jgi:ketosteroid isomerase-like protein